MGQNFHKIEAVRLGGGGPPPPSGQAYRFGGGGSPPSSLTASILWKFWPILYIIKWQNNPKYDNLSRNFYIFLTASGEGGEGSTQAVSLTAFFPFFFLITSLILVIKNTRSNIILNPNHHIRWGTSPWKPVRAPPLVDHISHRDSSLRAFPESHQSRGSPSIYLSQIKEKPSVSLLLITNDLLLCFSTLMPQIVPAEFTMI